MKLRWEDVYDIFDDAALWENGHDMYWYRLMWGLMEYRNMNEYDSDSDRVKVISRAFAIIKIYTDFIRKCFDDLEFEEIIDSYTGGVFECMYDASDVREIFSALHEELGTKRTFYSMFITCVEFRNGQISYEDEYEDEYEEYEYQEQSDYFDETDENYSECEEDYYFEEDDDGYPEDCSEDYYTSFESYLNVLATSSMSLLDDFTSEKAAGYIYLAKNMMNK